MRPASIAADAICSNTAAGAASTTMSASARSANPTSRGRVRKSRRLAAALARSRAATATRRSPSTPVSSARASFRPIAPRPPIATVFIMSPSSAIARASARSSGVLTLRKGSHFATAKSTWRMPTAAAKPAMSRAPGTDRCRRNRSRQASGHSATRWCVRPLLAAQAGAGASAAARPAGTNGVSPGTVSNASAPSVAAQSRPARTPPSGPSPRNSPSGSTGRRKSANRCGSPLALMATGWPSTAALRRCAPASSRRPVAATACPGLPCAARRHRRESTRRFCPPPCGACCHTLGAVCSGGWGEQWDSNP